MSEWQIQVRSSFLRRAYYRSSQPLLDNLIWLTDCPLIKQALISSIHMNNLAKRSARLTTGLPDTFLFSTILIFRQVWFLEANVTGSLIWFWTVLKSDKQLYRLAWTICLSSLCGVIASDGYCTQNGISPMSSFCNIRSLQHVEEVREALRARNVTIAQRAILKIIFPQFILSKEYWYYSNSNLFKCVI